MTKAPTRRLGKRLLLIALVVGAIAAYAVVKRPWEARPIALAVENVATGPVSQVLAVNGRIAARSSVTIRAGISAQAVSVNVDEGEQVKPGQVLAKLDTAIVEAQVEQASAGLEAQQTLQRQAQAAVDRTRALGPNSPRAVLEDAEFRLASAQQETARLEAVLRQAQRQLAEFTIRAPIAGVVVDRDVDAGQFIDVQTEMFEIADTRDLVVESDIDELYSAFVREGLKALLKPVGTSAVRSGTVVFAAPTVNSETGGRKIKIAFDEKVALPIGLTVNANVIVNEVENALSVPRSAIVAEAGKNHVLVIENGTVARREIVFNDWPSERVIVTEGLRAGDAVVLDATAVRPGDSAVPG